MANDDRIFVQLASYRDPELPRTIADAVAQAKEPERLTFGVCAQYDDHTGDDLAPWRTDRRVRIDAVPWQESRGCCWARHRVGALYDGEAYTLQVDAHTRFAPRWDTRFVAMLEGIDADRPLLTTYPKRYDRRRGKDVLDLHEGIERLALAELRANLTTVQRGEPAPDPDTPGESHFVAAGLIFSRGRFCTDVPYDPDLYFHGEEISLAVRAFSHGYALRYPTENLVWHRYDHDAPLHWSDHADTHRASHGRGIERLHTLLLGDASSLDPYGLGPVHSVADYEAYAGIDFAARRRGRTARPVRFRRFVALDTAAVPDRDDYTTWVFALLNDDDEELFRRDLTDPKLLEGETTRLGLDVELVDTPTRYVLWPRSSDGWGTRIVRPLPGTGP